MARNPFKMQGIPKLPKEPGMKLYSDKNLNKQMKLESDKNFSNPPANTVQGTDEQRKARFKRLAGILGGLHKK